MNRWGVGAVAGWLLVSMVPAAERPNVLVYLIDDQDLSECGPFAKPGSVWTPNLDRLAKEGMKFNRAYVPHTVCTPSRYAILTGRYASKSYSKTYVSDVGTDRQGSVNFNVALESDNMNGAAVLSKAGYATGFVGKFHVGPDGENASDEGGSQKFSKDLKDSPETSALFRQRGDALADYLKERGFTWADAVMHGNLDRPYGEHNPDWMVDAALAFMEQNRDRPFFLQVCSTLLHGPDNSWMKGMDYPEITGDGRVKPPPEWMKRRKAVLEQAKKAGFSAAHEVGIAWMDSNVGVLLDKLEALGIAKNTLVVFLPDHGSSVKSSLFGVNGAQIPLLMRWPAVIPAGSSCDELVQSIDLMPTFFALANATVPGQYPLDGRSLAPLLKTGRADGWRDSLFFDLDNMRAVTTKNWKYIATRYTVAEVAKIKNAEPQQLPSLMSALMTRGASHPGFFEEDQLYDLRKDPLEMNNLAKNPEFAAQLAAMQQLLTPYLESIGRPFGEFVPGEGSAPGGQIEEQIALVKQLKLQGKTVTVPAHLSGGSSKTYGSKEAKQGKSRKK